MSTPTPPLPNGWTFSDETNTTAVAPDGNTATGQVLQAVFDLVSAQTQIDTLNQKVDELNAEIAKLQGTTDDDSSEDNAIAALQQTVTIIQTGLQDTQAALNTLQGQFAALPDIAGTFATIASEIAALQTATQNAPSDAINQLIAELQAAQQPAPQQ